MFVVMTTRTYVYERPPYSHCAAIRATKELAIIRMGELVAIACEEGQTSAGKGNGWQTTRGYDEGKPFIDTYTVEMVTDSK